MIYIMQIVTYEGYRTSASKDLHHDLDAHPICSMCVSFSPAVLQDVSPDDGAQEEITTGLSGFAGSFKADGRK